MNQYFLKKESKELHAFPHIIEFALKKTSTIQFDSLRTEASESIRLYYVIDGRFNWIIEEQHYILYPGILADNLMKRLLSHFEKTGDEKKIFH